MPPELFRVPHSHGPAADWFALGVTLHELVLGCKPYARKELAENTCVVDGLHCSPIPAFVRSDRPEVRALAADLSAPCLSFMEQMLQSDMTYRLGSSDGLHEIQAHPWLECVDWKALAAREVAVPMRLQCPVGLHRDADLRVAHSMLAKHPVPADKQDHFSHYKYRDALYTADQTPIPVDETARAAGVYTTGASSATTHESVPSESAGSPDKPGWVMADGLRDQCARSKAVVATKLGLLGDGMLSPHMHRVTPATVLALGLESGAGSGLGNGSGSGSGKPAATTAATASNNLHGSNHLNTWGHCKFKCGKKSATAIAITGPDGACGTDTSGPATIGRGTNPLRANDDVGVSLDVLGSSSKSMVDSDAGSYGGTYDSASLGGDRDCEAELESQPWLSAGMEETKDVALLL